MAGVCVVVAGVGFKLVQAEKRKFLEKIGIRVNQETRRSKGIKFYKYFSFSKNVPLHKLKDMVTIVEAYNAKTLKKVK